MPSSNCIVRRMSRAELDLVVGWAQQEGWNPGLHDTDSFYATDPNGFFLCEVNNEPIGSISAVAYDDTYGFMGFYIVREPFRGQGYGMSLWKAAIQYMGQRTIGADGVPTMLTKYKTQGFHIAYRNIRFGCLGGGQDSPTLHSQNDVPFYTLDTYDRAHVPVPRTTFLRHWLNQPHSVIRIAMDHERIIGYGMLRPCQTVYKIGPLFANNADIANTIFKALCAHVPTDNTVYLDVPEPNTNAMEMATTRGMKAAFETSRIYKGPAPLLNLDSIYGVTSFELG